MTDNLILLIINMTVNLDFLMKMYALILLYKRQKQ